MMAGFSNGWRESPYLQKIFLDLLGWADLCIFLRDCLGTPTLSHSLPHKHITIHLTEEDAALTDNCTGATRPWIQWLHGSAISFDAFGGSKTSPHESELPPRIHHQQLRRCEGLLLHLVLRWIGRRRRGTGTISSTVR